MISSVLISFISLYSQMLFFLLRHMINQFKHFIVLFCVLSFNFFAFFILFNHFSLKIRPSHFFFQRNIRISTWNLFRLYLYPCLFILNKRSSHLFFQRNIRIIIWAFWAFWAIWIFWAFLTLWTLWTFWTIWAFWAFWFLFYRASLFHLHWVFNEGSSHFMSLWKIRVAWAFFLRFYWFFRLYFYFNWLFFNLFFLFLNNLFLHLFNFLYLFWGLVSFFLFFFLSLFILIFLSLIRLIPFVLRLSFWLFFISHINQFLTSNLKFETWLTYFKIKLSISTSCESCYNTYNFL